MAFHILLEIASEDVRLWLVFWLVLCLGMFVCLFVCLFVFFGLVFLNSLAISHAVIRAQYHPGIENLRNLCFAIVTFHAKPLPTVEEKGRLVFPVASQLLVFQRFVSERRIWSFRDFFVVAFFAPRIYFFA